MNPVWPVLVVGSFFSVLFSQVVPMENKDYLRHESPRVVQQSVVTPETASSTNS